MLAPALLRDISAAVAVAVDGADPLSPPFINWVAGELAPPTAAALAVVLFLVVAANPAAELAGGLTSSGGSGGLFPTAGLLAALGDIARIVRACYDNALANANAGDHNDASSEGSIARCDETTSVSSTCASGGVALARNEVVLLRGLTTLCEALHTSLCDCGSNNNDMDNSETVWRHSKCRLRESVLTDFAKQLLAVTNGSRTHPQQRVVHRAELSLYANIAGALTVGSDDITPDAINISVAP